MIDVDRLGRGYLFGVVGRVGVEGFYRVWFIYYGGGFFDIWYKYLSVRE